MKTNLPTTKKTTTESTSNFFKTQPQKTFFKQHKTDSTFGVKLLNQHETVTNAPSSFNMQVYELFLHIFNQDELDLLKATNDRYLSQKSEAEMFDDQKFELLTGGFFTQTATSGWKQADSDKDLVSNSGFDLPKIRQNIKSVFAYIRGHRAEFNALSMEAILHLHDMLFSGFDIPSTLRGHQIKLVNTNYEPLESKIEVEAALALMCDLINKQPNPFAKSFISTLLLAYIQPFEDGNKRIGALLGNAFLIANNIHPILYKDVNLAEFKMAMISFYEKGNIETAKNLFINYFIKAVETDL